MCIHISTYMPAALFHFSSGHPAFRSVLASQPLEKSNILKGLDVKIWGRLNVTKPETLGARLNGQDT